MSNFRRVDFLHQSSKVIGIKPIHQDKVTPVIAEEKAEKRIEANIRQAESILENAKQQSEALISKAQSEIKADKEQWQLEKEKLAEQAYSEGYEQGFRQGKEESSQAYEQLITQAKTVIDSAKMEYESIIDRSEESILRLSVKIAEKILHTELTQHDHYLALVREVLTGLRGQSMVAIYSNPDDYQLILPQKEELLQLVPVQTEVYFYPDTSLTPGACMVETPFGKIDAGVDSQLNEIKQKLLGVYQEQMNEH